jgi:ubiquinone/menaquinone biosynthesis C-methylase UbiE
MQMTTVSDTLAPSPAPDLAALKARQQATWASGDYSVIGTTLQIVGETLCEAVDLRAGERVLDVAAGNGNASLAAARRFAVVTSTDYVPALLERGKARAAADGLEIAFAEADAEALPFPDASFDVVLSTFGVMFTADHRRAADELLRVVRPEGRIGLANWTPEGFIGRLFATIGRHVAPPPGARSPALWGKRAWVEETFGPAASRVVMTPRLFTFRYRSAEHWLEVFRSWYGPLLKAFGALDAAGGAALEQDILALVRDASRAEDGTAVVPAEYLEIVIHRA